MLEQTHFDIYLIALMLPAQLDQTAEYENPNKTRAYRLLIESKTASRKQNER